MALSLAMSAILKPPSLTTLAKHAYVICVLSIFSPRALQQYLKALRVQYEYEYVRCWNSGRHILKIAHFTEEGSSSDDSEANPESPDKTAEDGDNFVAEELREMELKRKMANH